MSKWINLLFFFLAFSCLIVESKIKLSKLAKHSDVKWIRTNVRFIKNFLKQGGGENGLQSQENIPIRKNLITLNNNLTELNALNEALGNMKKGDTNDWMSFENIANYHGRPNLCKNDWNMTYPDNPDGKNSRGCCVHYPPQHIPKNAFFAAWHRLFMVNFESSLKSFGSSSLTLPYWDWTELTNTANGLPLLANTYPEWMNGPMKGKHGVTHRNPENGIPVEEIRTVHYKVYSDDGNGNSIDSNLYKPTNEYIDANEEITIRYHVNYFDEYCSILRLNEKVAWLEFLNDDGSFATGVTSDGSEIPASPYLLIDPQTFNYDGNSIKIIL